MRNFFAVLELVTILGASPFLGLSQELPCPKVLNCLLPSQFDKTTVWKESTANEFLRSGDYGQNETKNEPWVVFSDREQNITYRNPNINSTVYDTLKLNERLRIAEIQNDFALVITEPLQSLTGNKISSEARCRGWVPMSKLLLWPTAIADSYNIYYKALIVSNLDNGASSIQKCILNPDKKFDEKLCKPLSTDGVFYFIVKRASDGSVLLSKNYKITKEDDLIGWIETNCFTPWNQRTCLEPNWTPEVVNELAGKGDSVVFFTSKEFNESVGYYKFKKEINIKDSKPTSHYRLSEDVLRYPILENLKDYYKCTFFTYANGNLNEAIKQRHELEQKKDSIAALKNKLNLILVIDATTSMEPYYPGIAQAIKTSVNRFPKNEQIKVGIVLYKDYEDKDKMIDFQMMLPISDSRVETFIINGGKFGIGQTSNDKTHTEALYQGLSAALDTEKLKYKSGENNLMIVVGDCGNDENKDKENGYSKINDQHILNLLLKNNIQLMAFQVDSKNMVEWELFQDQMGNFIYENLNTVYKGWNTRIKSNIVFQDESNKKIQIGYDIIPADSDGKELYIGALRYAPINTKMKASSLTELLNNNLDRFAQTINNQNILIRDIDNHIATINTKKTTLNKSQEGFLNKNFSAEQIADWRKNGTMLAKTGYTLKKNASEFDFWKPILYITENELDFLIEVLRPVFEASKNSQDKDTYVKAMKGLAKTLVGDADIKDKKGETTKEESVQEIMNRIYGINAKPTSLSKFSIEEIQDDDIVSPQMFKKMVIDFKDKYQILTNEIKDDDYAYRWYQETTGNIYYWIPVDDLP